MAVTSGLTKQKSFARVFTSEHPLYEYGGSIALRSTLIRQIYLRANRFGGLRTVSIEFPFEPVLTEQFHRVLRADRPVTATQIVGGAVLVAPPANTFRVFRMERYFGVRHLFFPKRSKMHRLDGQSICP